MTPGSVITITVLGVYALAILYGLACDCRRFYEDRRMARLRELGDRRWACDESRMPEPAGLDLDTDEWFTTLDQIGSLPVGSPRGW